MLQVKFQADGLLAKHHSLIEVTADYRSKEAKMVNINWHINGPRLSNRLAYVEGLQDGKALSLKQISYLP
jgi:hypothetical protein